MASKSFGKTLRAASAARAPTLAVPRRGFTSVLAARPASAKLTRAQLPGPIQVQTRGVKTIDFAGSKETVFGNDIASEAIRSATDRYCRTG